MVLTDGCKSLKTFNETVSLTSRPVSDQMKKSYY